MTFRPCAVVPSRNHHQVIGDVVARLTSAGLPVFVIDDGSAEPSRTAIGRLHDPENGVTVFRFNESQGKGGAVVKGFRLAAAANFTHVLQVDADGQHDLAELPNFLDLARRHPEALISGRPIFDRSIPLARRMGRWITHVWVWIETLSFRLVDTMCGFRVYPLTAVNAVLAEEPLGRRMDFDTEIMVRLFWRGVLVVPVPVCVVYPEGNTSNFDAVRDNWYITRMHTRLVFGMLARLPAILRHRPPVVDPPSHWAALAERGFYFGLLFSALVIRLIGRRGCLVVLSPFVLYFYVAGREQRNASRDFLARAFAAQGIVGKPSWMDGYKHFLSFANGAVDNFAAWIGRLPPESVIWDESAVIGQAAADPSGALLIVSHLGNADISRALLDAKTLGRINVLVHTQHAVHYNEVLHKFNPDAAVKIQQVTEMGPETTIDLREKIDRGEWVVIAGDRTPVNSQGRVSRVAFLGKDAAFAHGPFILAALLGCPVYTLTCLRDGKGYRLYVDKFADRVTLPRHERETALREIVLRYASRLEHYVIKAPYQWYNFFDFWA